MPLILYFICLGHIPKKLRGLIQPFLITRLQVHLMGVQPWTVIARLWQWPFVSYLVSSDQSLIISTLLRFSHIYFKLFSSCFICTLFICCVKHSVHAFVRKEYSSGTSSCCRAVENVGLKKKKVAVTLYVDRFHSQTSSDPEHGKSHMFNNNFVSHDNSRGAHLFFQGVPL